MRKTQEITINDPASRDHGRTYCLTEMSAAHAERWAIRALLAIGQAGVELPDGVMQAGMAGLAQAGLGALMQVSFEAAQPLLDEMMDCVQIVHNGTQRPINDDADDIEEVATRLKLRHAVFELHVGFLTAAVAPHSPATAPDLTTLGQTT